MKIELAIILCLLSSLAAGADRELVTLTDPAKDDVGNGALVYPERSDFSKGDLDLRNLKVSRDGKGFWFEAAFANPIRNPKQATTGVGPEPMPVNARRGFYTFNIDIYIDTDREAGSGNTFTLPGRKVRIDPAYAWERAIILSPMPEQARSQMFEALSRQFPERSMHEVEASIAQAVFFPTEVRVRGKSIAFFVPKVFIGNSDGSDWAVTTLVTGAKPFSALGITFGASNKTPLESLDMGAMQPGSGRPDDTFGYESARQGTPIVDALMPTAALQIAMLSNNVPLTGMSWGPHAVNETALAERHEGAARAYVNPGPSPAAEGSLLSNSWSGLKSLFGMDSGRREAASTTSAKPIPVQSLLDPGQPGAATSMTAPASAKPGVAERLRTLKQLYDDKLIDEVEYNKYKQRVLDDL